VALISRVVDVANWTLASPGVHHFNAHNMPAYGGFWLMLNAEQYGPGVSMLVTEAEGRGRPRSTVNTTDGV
jgi:hypothetical protein